MNQNRIVILSLALLASDVALGAQKSVELAATLKDGKTVSGTFERKSVKIKTAFGSAIVNADQLESIVFGKPDVITTKDDVTLTGVVEPKTFRLKIGKNRRTLRRNQLVSLARMSGGALAGGNTFSGKWSTNFGPMTLKQTGNRVKGTYGYTERSFTGKVKGKEGTFTYDGGEVTLTLAKGGQMLMGRYEGDGGRKGFWGGYRIQPKIAAPTPGKITTGQSKSWLNYHLRVPKHFDKNKRYPAIAFLHGSNMTSASYVYTIASRWPKLAEDYILVGFDGENLSRGSTPDRRAYNFSYVNFSGHEVGQKGRYRQSPALVAEALDELKGQLPISHWFLGGHSQGGFLTYAVYMFYPDKVAGVFPMSCNLLVQCEPDGFKDAAVRAKQRDVAIAVIHGENDNVVSFSGGESCYRSMVDGGFPMVRFFKHATAAHMFARLPVEQAVRWLEQMKSDDPKVVLSFAEKQFARNHYRGATAALQNLEKLSPPADIATKSRALAAKIDARALPDAKRFLEDIRRNRNNEWVDGFLAFREEFALTRAAKKTMAAYASLRDKHRKPADRLFWSARNLRDKEERTAKYRQIVEEYYASKWYEMVKGWLEP